MGKNTQCCRSPLEEVLAVYLPLFKSPLLCKYTAYSPFCRDYISLFVEKAGVGACVVVPKSFHGQRARTWFAWALLSTSTV